MKAVLVIDMPKDCDECPLNSDGYCDALQEYALLNEWVEDAPYYSLKEKGDCPLKPIHALKSAGKDYIVYERQYLYENLEREYELMKKAREYESGISD